MEYIDDKERQEKETDIQAIGIGILYGIAGQLLVITTYALIAMTDSYHPIFTLLIVVGPAFGYMLAVDRIKNTKKEKKEEIEGTGRKKSKFYTPQFGDMITSFEFTVGVVFTAVFAFIGVYIAEVLAFTFYVLKTELPPKPSFSDVFEYGFNNALQIEGSSSYIIWGWIGIAVFAIAVGIIAIIRKVKGKNIYSGE